MSTFNQHLKQREQMLAAAEKIAAKYDSQHKASRAILVVELSEFYENFFLNCRRSNIDALVSQGVLTQSEAEGHIEARAIFCEIHGFDPKLFG
ncbi:hypothetical protein D3C85_770520 [compost metagenome]